MYPGFEADFRLPLSTALINSEIAKKFQGRQSPVTGVAVAALGGGNAAIVIDVNQWPLPKRIEIPVVLSAAASPFPCITMTFIDPPTLLSMELPLLQAHLPSELTVDKAQARLDLRPLLSSIGFAPWLSNLHKLQLSVEPGRFVVDASIRVPESKTNRQISSS
jgi:hypothetical protein